MRSPIRRPRGWQIAALAAAGGLGALAVARRLSTPSAEAYSVFEGEQGRYAWTQGDIFYAVKGRGEPIVLVHGIYAGASSFEYRKVFNTLAERFRVYAFDLLGFGLSDRPPILYTPRLYAELVADFVRQVVGGVDNPVRVIASGLGAAFTIRAAAEHAGLFSRLVLVEPSGIEDLAGDPEERPRQVGRWLLRTPILGQGIYRLLTARPSLRYLLHRRYGSRVDLSDDLLDYYTLMAHQPGARFALASFISGTLDTPIKSEYESLRLPILLLWGKNATVSPLEHARAFRQATSRADLRVFDSGSLPQDEVAEEFAHEVTTWLETSRPSAFR